MADLIYKDESYLIRGAVFEVYKHLGPGFLESVYQEALEKELSLRSTPFNAQHQIQIEYKGFPLKQSYIADFLCFDKIIVEIKAVDKLSNIHTAQLHNYLKATKLKLGFLVNFNSYPEVEIQRIVN